jgi:hypothetical protein
MRTKDDEVNAPDERTSWAAIRERASRRKEQAERDVVDAMRIRRHREALALGWTDEDLDPEDKVDEERGEEALRQQQVEAAERASMEAAMRDQSPEYALGQPTMVRRPGARGPRLLPFEGRGQRTPKAGPRARL